MNTSKIISILTLGLTVIPLAVANGQETKSNKRIPFRLTPWNNISVPAVVNKNFAANLMFHTATSEISLTPKAFEALTEIEFSEEASVTSWGGDSSTKFARGIPIAIGPVVLKQATVFQSRHSGHQTEGKFGPRQLGSQLIEINFQENEIVLHRKQLEKTATWQQIPLKIKNGAMFIEGSLHTGDKNIKHEFLIHSGYSGFVMLDDEFVSKQKSIQNLKIIEENELTDSSGNKLKTQKALLPKISFGDNEFENVPISFFDGSIGKQKMSLVGGDFLKRFNIVFDLKDNILYLKSNNLAKSEYF